MKFKIKDLRLKIILCSMFCVLNSAFGTLSTTTTKQTYPCNGSTTRFTFSFPVQSASDVNVIAIKDSTGDYNSVAYSIAALNNDYANGGTVTTTATLPSGYTLVISRYMVLKQETSLENSYLDAEAIETELDKTRMIDQQQNEAILRCLRVPVWETNDMTIPTKANRAGKNLSFDSAGRPCATTVTTTGTTSFSTFGTDFVATENATSARALLGGPVLSDGSVSYTGNQPMAGFKITGCGTPTDENDVVDVNYVKNATITLKNKTFETPTITSPAINGDISGNAIDNDGNLAANSATKLATQYATKKYITDTTVPGAGFLKTNTTVDTPIFDSNLPTTYWQTLDVSTLGAPAVGANSAILFLEVKSANATYFYVKPYGMGSTTPAKHYSTSYPAGSAACYFGAADEYRYLSVMTNSAGKIQMSQSAAGTTYKVTIKLIGYIK